MTKRLVSDMHMLFCEALPSSVHHCLHCCGTLTVVFLLLVQFLLFDLLVICWCCTFGHGICGMATEGDVFEAIMARCTLPVDKVEVGVATASTKYCAG